MSAPRPPRRWDYDLLRVLSMLGVVYLHSAATVLRTASGALWHFANLLSSLATAAVPLFFMLSGALLLSQAKTAELSTLFRRRLPKVLLPLLVWSLAVALATLLRSGPEAAGNLLLNLLSTPAMVPYWFLYALVPIYLIAPLLRRMTAALEDAHWNYLILLWFILTIGVGTLHDFLPVDSSMRTLFTVHWTLNLDMIGGYLGYFLLGARLARLRRLPKRPLLWGGALVLWGTITVGTWWIYRTTGVYDERFKSYLHLFAAGLSALLFLLARSYGEGRRSRRGLVCLSGLSFGVYLAHPPVISLWQALWPLLFGGGVAGLGQHLLFFCAVLGCCLAGVFLLASVKPLCYPFTGQSFSAACRECNLFALLRRDGQ